MVTTINSNHYSILIPTVTTWWLIPLSKWVITGVINGISRVHPLITGVITHLLSGMSHQADIYRLYLQLPQRSHAHSPSASSRLGEASSCCLTCLDLLKVQFLVEAYLGKKHIRKAFFIFTYDFLIKFLNQGLLINLLVNSISSSANHTIP